MWHFMTWAPMGCMLKDSLPGSSNFRCMVHARSFAGESAWRTYPPRVKHANYAQQLSLRLSFVPHYYTTRVAVCHRCAVVGAISLSVRTVRYSDVEDSRLVSSTVKRFPCPRSNCPSISPALRSARIAPRPPRPLSRSTSATPHPQRQSYSQRRA